MTRRVALDGAVCSGLPRTRQTGEIVLADRGLDLATAPGLEEIRPTTGEASGGYDDLHQRICDAMHELVADPSWHNLAVFAHGGTDQKRKAWGHGEV